MRRYDLKGRRVLLLALAGLLLLLVVLVVTVRNVVVGTPDPKLPNEALFYTPPITRWDDKGVAERSGDFTARPLFTDARRPFEAAPAEAVSEVAQQKVQKGPVQTLEGWSLLGIFNSGEVVGAIVRQPDGSKSRVRIGEYAGNWKLTDVQSRAILFESKVDGSRAELGMALGALEYLVRDEPMIIQPDSSSLASGSEETAAGASESGDQEEPKERPKKRDPTTFGGFYRDG